MKNNKQQYTFIDLFAGLGGFHLALQQLGCKCVFASEIKDDLRKLYALNFPETPIYGDITKINPEDIPPHDIVCAGFPCQPFSQAGKREGFNDTKQRGMLFDYICAIVAEHRPKYLLLENVQNLKNHDNGNTWKVIQEKLAALNYDVKAEILSEGEPNKGRYMTIREAAAIQGMQDLNFSSLSSTRTLEALGNAINVTLVRRIAKLLLNDEQQ